MDIKSLSRFAEFRAAIMTLPVSAAYERSQLCSDLFLLGRAGNLEMFYAPFDFVNVDARVALVGVTPGWTQMHTSFVEARSGLDVGQSDSEILRRVKRVAAFSGPLRTNLVAMLDGIGLPEALEVTSTAHMFEGDGQSLLHSTSAVRYPVFKNGTNYTGSAPAIPASPLLAEYLAVLEAELVACANAVVVPLGRAVERALEVLIGQESVEGSRCLLGFPHPSGANAHRRAQYEQNRETMADLIGDWFGC